MGGGGGVLLTGRVLHCHGAVFEAGGQVMATYVKQFVARSVKIAQVHAQKLRFFNLVLP